MQKKEGHNKTAGTSSAIWSHLRCCRRSLLFPAAVLWSLQVLLPGMPFAMKAYKSSNILPSVKRSATTQADATHSIFISAGASPGRVWRKSSALTARLLLSGGGATSAGCISLFPGIGDLQADSANEKHRPEAGRVEEGRVGVFLPSPLHLGQHSCLKAPMVPALSLSDPLPWALITPPLPFALWRRRYGSAVLPLQTPGLSHRTSR